MTDRLQIARAAPGLIHVSGELDLASSPRLAEELEEITAATQGSLVLDVSELSFIDSTGLRVLIEAAERLQGGKLILRNPTRSVMEVLDVAGVAEVATNFAIERD